MKATYFYTISLFIFFASFWGTTTAFGQTKSKEPSKYPKNVILMIGDGMGLTQISAGIYSSKQKLHLEQFLCIGFQKTHSFDNLRTDSAAGATAFACGVKTFNGAIGLSADTLPCKTILEEAEERGLSTGLVATSTITHATPAAFAAHQRSRVMYEEIANDIAHGDVDLLIGGGLRYFNNRNIDGLDLIKLFSKKGYQVYSFLDGDLNTFALDYTKNFAYFSSNDEPLPVAQGRDYLPYASRFAPNFLNKHGENGFFLMIEGSQIDWAGHANNGNWMLSELLDFDAAIGEVLEFAEKDGETLVIVTADHETGGLAINPGSKMRKLELAFTTNDHSCSMVPVFAFGPMAELFRGIYDNTEIYHKIREVLRFTID